jgi:hypothetical protein
MEHSESIKNLAKALAKFQGEVRDPAKNEKNPFFKSKYVPLDELIEAVRPTLSANGLSIIQMPSGDGKTISLKTIILHESGEWIESDLFSLVIAKADAQGAGSGVTYARRYQLGAVLNIGWTDDDDGNSISGHEVKTAPAPTPKPTPKPMPQNTPKPTTQNRATKEHEERDRLLKEIGEKAREKGIAPKDLSLAAKFVYSTPTNQIEKVGELGIEDLREFAEKFESFVDMAKAMP